MEPPSGTNVHPSGSPEKRSAKYGRWSTPNPIGHPAESHDSNAMHRGTVSHDMTGRETPGGVALPDCSPEDMAGTEHQMSGLHLDTSGFEPHHGLSAFSDQFETQVGAQELPIYSEATSKRQSNSTSNNEASYYTSPTSLGSPEGTRSKNSPTDSGSPSTRADKAKEIAAFILSGGLEESPPRGGPGFQPTGAARQQPPMMNQQRPQRGSSFAGRGKPEPYPMQALSSGPTSSYPGPAGHGAGFGYTPGPPAQTMPQTYAMFTALIEKWRNSGGPTLAELLHHIPFVEKALTVQPINYGVIKISDIPFNATKPEIVATVGEKAPMVAMPRGTGSYAIHIIMERATAKSNDCYIEFETLDAAGAESARLQSARRLVGIRRARIHLSSQEELMTELFPKAQCVQWHGCQPVVQENRDAVLRGFKGFVTGEEMHATARIAENPSRYQFTNQHPQRTYESMISLLAKYPWTRTDLYTLKERNFVFKAAVSQIRALAENFRHKGSRPPLDFILLNDLFTAALKCPGFSERQRADIVDASNGLVEIREYVPQLAKRWPFEAIGVRNGSVPEMEGFILYLLDVGSAKISNFEPPGTPSKTGNDSGHPSTQPSRTPSGTSTPHHSTPSGPPSWPLARTTPAHVAPGYGLSRHDAPAQTSPMPGAGHGQATSSPNAGQGHSPMSEAFSRLKFWRSNHPNAPYINPVGYQPNQVEPSLYANQPTSNQQESNQQGMNQHGVSQQGMNQGGSGQSGLGLHNMGQPPMQQQGVQQPNMAQQNTQPRTQPQNYPPSLQPQDFKPTHLRPPHAEFKVVYPKYREELKMSEIADLEWRQLRGALRGVCPS